MASIWNKRCQAITVIERTKLWKQQSEAGKYLGGVQLRIYCWTAYPTSFSLTSTFASEYIHSLIGLVCAAAYWHAPDTTTFERQDGMLRHAARTPISVSPCVQLCEDCWGTYHWIFHTSKETSRIPGRLNACSELESRIEWFGVRRLEGLDPLIWKLIMTIQVEPKLILLRHCP